MKSAQVNDKDNKTDGIEFVSVAHKSSATHTHGRTGRVSDETRGVWVAPVWVAPAWVARTIAAGEVAEDAVKVASLLDAVLDAF